MGIGTATPTVALDVVGDGNFTLGASQYVSIDNDGKILLSDGSGDATSFLGLSFGGGTIANISFPFATRNTGGLKIGTSSNYPVSFTMNGVTKMYLAQTTGYVGIGTTTPSHNLTVVGTINATETILVGTNINISSMGGKVGIGTLSPTHRLHVVGFSNLTEGLNAGNGTLFVNTSSVGIGTTTPVYSLEIANSAMAFNASGSLYANTSNVWMNKNVGINTINPTQALDVNGGINMTTGQNFTTGGGQIYWDAGNARLVIKVS